jgi:fatty-acid desaturase
MSDIALPFVSTHSFTTTVVDVPHRRDDALEPAEKHRSYKVHRLVRLVLVTLGCLACTEERQKGSVQLQLHEPGDR